MRRIITLSLMAFLATSTCFSADQTATTTFPQTKWVSKNSTDAVTIQNGAGTQIVVVINVSNDGNHSDGVNVNNCGTTTYIKAGSSTICSTNDSQNPITLTSDSVSLSASGTYQLKQQQQ